MAPAMKVTVPEGVGPVPVTVAVKVTDWPYVEGLPEVATVVVDEAVLAERTFNVKIPWKSVSSG